MTEQKEFEEKEKANIPAVEKKEANAKGKKILIIIIIVLIVIFLGLMGILAFTQGGKIISNIKYDKYGINYNLDKIRSYDWDSLLTEKRIALALDVPQKQIATAKNPVSSGIIEDPEGLISSDTCTAILNDKILNQTDQNKNLLDVNVMLCNTIAKTNEFFDGRKDSIKNVKQQDPTMNVSQFNDLKGIGQKAYSYIVTRTADNNGTKSTTTYGGLIFQRGPYILRIEESVQDGGQTAVTPEILKEKLARYIDNELTKTLLWY